MNTYIMIWILSVTLVYGANKSNETRSEMLEKFMQIYANEVSESHEVHPYIRFDDHYNTKKMPLNSLPLDVNLTINIKNIYGVDEVNQLLGMETTVQMNWIDERITLLDIGKEHINLDRITLPSEVSD